MTILHYFANERHILHGEYRQVLTFEIVSEDVYGLQIEGALSEYSSYQSSLLEIWLNLLQNCFFCMSRRTNYDYVSIVYYFPSFVGYFHYFAS